MSAAASRAAMIRRHFFSYCRGALAGHPGLRKERGVRLRGPGTYRFAPGCVIRRGAHLWVGSGATLDVGRGSRIGPKTKINVAQGVTLGAGVEISWEVQLLDTDFHWTTAPGGRMRPHQAPITIGDHVLIGTRAMVLKGVTIGDGAVIGAGAVVRRDVEAGVIVAGDPAEQVGRAESWGTA